MKSGFIEKVKDFIHDIGEKIEEAIGFGTVFCIGNHLHFFFNYFVFNLFHKLKTWFLFISLNFNTAV